MESQVELEQYYNQLAAWYVKTYDINAINMEIFWGGYDLYVLGKKLGFEEYTEVLIEFLLGAELAVKSEEDNKTMQIGKKGLISGVKHHESIETSYNRIVSFFIKTGDMTRIMYQRFLIGYTLYQLGKNLGCIASASILGEYLRCIQVITIENEESISVLDIRTEASQPLETTNQR